MSSITVAVLFMLAIWAFYIGFLLFTDFFVKTVPYLNVMVINYFWFSASQTVYGHDIFYPDIFGNKWLNFFLCSAGIIFVTYLLIRVKEVKAAFLITSGALCMLTSFGVVFEKVVIGDFPGVEHIAAGDLPMWVEPLFIGIGVTVVLVVLVLVSRHPEYDEPGNFYLRFFACIILAPTPFILTASLLLRQGESTELTERQKLLSLIVMLVTILIYYLFDTFSDNRRIQLEQEKDRMEVLRAQMRSEISSAVRKRMDEIDDCMGYLRNNFRFLKDTTRSSVSALYNEAKDIEKSYLGTADGDILKRLTEIKTALDKTRTALSEEMRRASRRNSERKEDSRNSSGNTSGGDNTGKSDAGQQTENGQEQSVISAFFNGCASDDEIRKRYHQLCKVFHPDAGNGDEETFVLIKEEYDRLIKK